MKHFLDPELLINASGIPLSKGIILAAFGFEERW